MMTTNTLRTASAEVRPASTAERAMGRARNRSIKPFCRSSDRPTAVPDGTEQHRLHENAGHHVVDVGHAAGDGDGAAEHVAEQQDEHDGLQRREEQCLGDARDGEQVAPGDGDGVGHRPAQAVPRGGGCGNGGHRDGRHAASLPLARAPRGLACLGPVLGAGALSSAITSGSGSASGSASGSDL